MLMRLPNIEDCAVVARSTRSPARRANLRVHHPPPVHSNIQQWREYLAMWGLACAKFLISLNFCITGR